MRKPLLIGGAVIGAVILVAIALAAYAALNLNRIIARNRAYVLARVSDSIGRAVEVRDIRAALGWGVVLDVTGLKIADDPAFSQLPMIQVAEVVGEAEFIPLLFGRVTLKRLVFKQPEVRIIRDGSGKLNLTGIGKKTAKTEAGSPSERGPSSTPVPSESEPKPRQSSEFVQKLAVNNFSIRGGKVSYRDPATGNEALEASSIDLDITHFGMSRQFGISLKLAVSDTDQNFAVTGEVGPLMRDGSIEAGAIPIDLKVNVGPVLLEKARRMPLIARSIPPKLLMSEAIETEAKIQGTLDSLKFAMNTDLSKARVIYQGLLDKPAGLTLRLKVSGSRDRAAIGIDQATVSFGDMDLTAQRIRIASGVLQARVDTNRFDLAGIAKASPSAGRYNPAGTTEIHADLDIQMPRSEVAAYGSKGEGSDWVKIRFSGPRIAARGTVSLSRVAIKPEGGKIPAIANLTGNIRLTGDGAVIEPTTFDLGSGRAKFQAKIGSFDPLKGDYRFSDDSVKLAELVPSRKSDNPEELRQLSMTGTLGGALSDPRITTDLSSTAGSVANVDYQGLALAAAYGDRRVDLKSLKLNAFGGAILGSANAAMTEARPFQARLNLDNIDLQRALESQKAKAAAIVRGSLTGQVEISGAGAGLEQIKPTLRGGGKANIRDGKLVGINVAAEAMKRAREIPGVGDLAEPGFIERHPEIFATSDTDIKKAGLTFTVDGPRITSHDLTVESTGYRLSGDGSFDLDKNVDMGARIVLSKALSDELEGRKKNIVYLANRDGEVEIPLQIVGVLPKPRVLPDVQAMAQTAAQHAIQKKAGKFLGGLLGNGGLGGAVRGRGSGRGTPGSGAPPPPNPLAPLEKLFR